MYVYEQKLVNTSSAAYYITFDDFCNISDKTCFHVEHELVK